MRLLLDTCTFLPPAADDSQSRPAIRSKCRDPFDRGLVSTAILNGMTIVTPDAAIARYPAPVLW